MTDTRLRVTAHADLENSLVVSELARGSLNAGSWQGVAPDGKAYPVQVTDCSNGQVVGVQVSTLGSEESVELSLAPAEGVSASRGIELDDQAENGRVVIKYSGFLQSIYHYGPSNFKPRFYPITVPCARLGEIDDPRTLYPKSITDDSPPDHIWHRSLWYACGDVNGVDFYLENGGEGRTVHREFTDLFSGPLFGGFRETLTWIAPNGKSLLDDVRTFTMYRLKGTLRMFDIGADFTAREEPVTFGATNENALPLIRVADVIDEWDGGTITLADGTVGGKDGFARRAEWADCSGPLARWEDGSPWTWGIAMLDNPSNRNHPNAWFARSYGPLGTNLPFFDGALTLAPGETWSLRHRIIVHEGTPEEAGIPARFSEYAAGATVEIA
jgi:hypothetical protein